MSLAKTSLIISLLGIAILLFLSRTLEPRTIKLADIASSMPEQLVKIEGMVVASKNYEKITVLAVDDGTGKIDAVAYGLGNENLTGKNVRIIGKIREYNKKLEIEAEKIVEK